VLVPTTRLTVVAAPPGYGKSVAVAGWIADRGIPVAWVDLDATARDPARLARLALAALADARPAASSLVPAIALGTTPDPIALGDLLLDAIATDDTDLVVVFDDCHLADSPDAMAVLRRLAGRMPPFAHLVLVGREEPAIPMGRLRAHGGLVEIRAADLRFSTDEGRSLLRDAGASAPERVVDVLVARTEGWAAALQLAAISVAREGKVDAVTDAVAGTNRYLIDYLGDEVMAGLDADLGEVLAAAAVAETFSPALVGAMAGRDDADALVERAERANLFVVPLDSDRRWYRMHGLFADFLRSRMAAAEQRRLHAAAAAWLDAEGMGRDALLHALEADEPDRAAYLVAREGRAALEAGEVRTLLGWIARLPPDVRDADPEIAWLEAWGRFYTGDLAGAAAIATRAGAAAAVGSVDRSSATGRLLVLRALIGTTLDPAAEQIARQGIAILGDDDLFRSLGLQAAGLAQLARGDVQGSLETLRAAFDAAEASAHPIAVLPAVNPLGHALIASGRRDEAEAVARRVLAAFPGLQGEPLAVAWPARLTLGIALIEGGDPVGAREQLERGLASASSLGVGREVLGWAVPAIAMARQATGDIAGASTILERGPVPSLAFPSLVGETRARLDLARGDVAAASRWADDARPEAPAGSPMAAFLGASAALTVARVRLADGRPTDALQMVASARAFYETSGSIPDLISCDLIAATGAMRAGDRATARAGLASAVRLAAAGGYVRRFVDDGPLLAGLFADVLDDLDDVDGASAFARRVRMALREAAALPGTVRRGTSVLVAPDGTLVESLTSRELDILRLLATGARNAEVADALGMSAGTAKWHVAHVLAKLGVTSRTGAVVRGQDLGLI
jgi:LuxR family maltose regulon positive regulatory protein